VDICSALSRATDLLDGNNQQYDIVVLEDYLKELVSIIGGIKVMGKIG